jgi:hypothetical protein
MKDEITAITAMTKALAIDTDCRGRGMWEAVEILNAFCARRGTPVIPAPFTEQSVILFLSGTTTITIDCEDADDTDTVFDWLTQLH